MRILYVEDMAVISMAVTQDLEDAGFDVESLARCSEGWEFLKKNSVDLLITDINTPGDMDGWDLGIKAREINDRLPIIYTTAFGKDVDRIVEDGVYLPKPFTTKELLGSIKKVT